MILNKKRPEVSALPMLISISIGTPYCLHLNLADMKQFSWIFLASIEVSFSAMKDMPRNGNRKPWQSEQLLLLNHCQF